MTIGKNESKILTKDKSCECNLKLIEENVIQIKSEIVINVDLSLKNITYVEKIISVILLNTIVKMGNI